MHLSDLLHSVFQHPNDMSQWFFRRISPGTSSPNGKMLRKTLGKKEPLPSPFRWPHSQRCPRCSGFPALSLSSHWLSPLEPTLGKCFLRSLFPFQWLLPRAGLTLPCLPSSSPPSFTPLLVSPLNTRLLCSRVHSGSLLPLISKRNSPRSPSEA